MLCSEELLFSDAGDGVGAPEDTLATEACWLPSAAREHPASEVPKSAIPTSVTATRAALCPIT
jgi:hypothetical protein